MTGKQGTVRVVVQDRRRLLREGLALLLDAEPGVELIAAGSDVPLPTGGVRVDVLLRSDREQGTPPAGARVVSYTGRETFAALVTAVLADPPEPESSRPDAARLTSRELQVIRCIAEGLSTTSIAQHLGIAPKSVDNHRQRIFTKLGVHSASQAAGAARRRGLLGPAYAGDSGSNE